MMIRRSGTTLIEVLVAIFVTAIGLLGLLALFPLGAVNMAQSIKDSRCAQAAANAFALADALNIRNDPVVTGAPDRDVFIDDDQHRRPPANLILDGPSYPVYVDPLGVLNSMPGSLGQGAIGIPRRSISFVKSIPTAAQWFSVLDDINFVKDGPSTGLACPQGLHVAGAGAVQREGRYSWSYLLRRPRSSDKSIVDLTVVVYSGRPTVFGRGENTYGSVTFDTTSNVVRVHWGAGQEKPPVRAGGWILDATMVKSQPGGGHSPQVLPDPHGFFYRVVNATEGSDSAGPYLDLELQTNPKLSTLTGQGVLVVLDGVAEVFEKGPGWRP